MSGRPENGVHAIQMELAPSAYLVSETPPFAMDPANAEIIRRRLARVLEQIEAAAFS